MADTPRPGKAPAAPEPETPEPPPGVPHFYIATEPLYVHNPESGVMPVQVFAAGDRVPAGMVEPRGWQAGVRIPDPPPAPEPAPSPPPRPAPAAAPAETASKEQ